MDIASLVLGIFAICFSLVPSIIALPMAILSIVLSYKAKEAKLNTGCAKGGLVCSWVAIGLIIMVIITILVGKK